MRFYALTHQSREKRKKPRYLGKSNFLYSGVQINWGTLEKLCFPPHVFDRNSARRWASNLISVSATSWDSYDSNAMRGSPEK